MATYNRNLKTNTMKQTSSYASEFSEKSFWGKMTSIASGTGRKLLTMALEMFYAWKYGNLSAREKLVIAGALGYLILPVDMIPDFLPGGYADDMAALAAAYKTVSRGFTAEVRQRAQAKVNDILE